MSNTDNTQSPTEATEATETLSGADRSLLSTVAQVITHLADLVITASMDQLQEPVLQSLQAKEVKIGYDSHGDTMLILTNGAALTPQRFAQALSTRPLDTRKEDEDNEEMPSFSKMLLEVASETLIRAGLVKALKSGEYEVIHLPDRGYALKTTDGHESIFTAEDFQVLL